MRKPKMKRKEEKKKEEKATTYPYPRERRFLPVLHPVLVSTERFLISDVLDESLARVFSTFFNLWILIDGSS